MLQESKIYTDAVIKRVKRRTSYHANKLINILECWWEIKTRIYFDLHGFYWFNLFLKIKNWEKVDLYNSYGNSTDYGDVSSAMVEFYNWYSVSECSGWVEKYILYLTDTLSCRPSKGECLMNEGRTFKLKEKRKKCLSSENVLSSNF